MSGYGAREVAKMLGLSLGQVRAYVRAGFLEPTRGPRGELRFSFQDLVLLRTAQGLVSARIAPRRVRSALRKLKERLPEGRPLRCADIPAGGDPIRGGRPALPQGDRAPAGQRGGAVQPGGGAGGLAHAGRGDPRLPHRARGGRGLRRRALQPRPALRGARRRPGGAAAPAHVSQAGAGVRPRVGTSGYNYEAWRGSFYPEDPPAKKMLGYYADRFDTVEINYSFYRKPAPKILEGWAAQVPERFRFALKAWQRITHQKRLRDVSELVSSFADAARALGPRLAPVLYQLPPNLKADVALLRDFLHQLPRDLRAAFEFRHESWFTDETFAALRDAGAALCVAESEELATPVVRTADFAYLRLRRLDYDEAALSKWADFAKASPGDVFVYFKHEDEARGPVFAQQFLAIGA